MSDEHDRDRLDSAFYTFLGALFAVLAVGVGVVDWFMVIWGGGSWSKPGAYGLLIGAAICGALAIGSFAAAAVCRYRDKPDH